MTNHYATYHQLLSAIPVCLTEFSIGIAFGWVAPMIREFLEDPNSEITATEAECSWMASMTLFGRTFGPLFSLMLLDVLGRTFMVGISAAIFFLIWLVIFFTRSMLILCITFFVYGFGIGICNASSGIYLGENCSPHLRGIFCSVSVTGFYLGVLFQYIIAEYLSYSSLGAVNLAMAFFCLLGTLWLLVESPQFLMLKGRFNKAEKNMMWLKGTKNREEIAKEFEIIKSNISSEKLKKASYKELFTSPANYKSLIVVLVLNAAHAATGNGALFTYISVLFPQNEFFTPYQITVYFGISQMAFCFLASFVIENFNRRTLTLIAFVMFLLCHSTAAYFLYDSAFNAAPVKYGVWIIFISVCIFSGFTAVLDSVVHMVRGELFPQSIKPIGSGLSISSHSLAEFFTIVIFLRIKSHYGAYMNFVGYAIVSFASFWFSYFVLPETRGKTLIEIQKSLEKKSMPNGEKIHSDDKSESQENESFL